MLGPARSGPADVVVDGDVIAWSARRRTSPTDRVVELDGALVLPAFVDAHVHATDTGLALTGLDLTDA